MITPSPRYQSAIADIDAANGDDPRHDLVAGQSRPREVVYAERMSACLNRLYPHAPEVLRIAARAQHIRRWEIPRANYPVGRDGYNAWRSAARFHHAELATAIMRRHGYAETDTAHVARIIKKEQLKQDADSQALENVVGAVFFEHYLPGFIASHAEYSQDKLIGILRNTLRKMDAAGHAAVLALALPANLRRAIDIAMK